MRLFRRLLSTFDQAVDSTLQQGGAGDDLILHRLRNKLDALGARCRRLTRTCGILFILVSAALVASAFAPLGLGARAALTAVLTALLATATLCAVESLRVATLIEALDELLLGGAPLRPMDVVLAFRDRVLDELSEAPPWEPLVSVLTEAYDTPAEARAILQRAGIPLGPIGMSQPMLHLWQDALRTAHRCQKLDALVNHVLADPLVTAHHQRVRERSSRLAAR